MLKMKCVKCREMIISPLLADLEDLSCPHCNTMVPVQDIMVTAEGFTFHRNDLNKRLHTYKNLLQDLLKERELLDQDPEASKEGKRSLERMAQALKDLMATGRNNYRARFEEMPVMRYQLNSNWQNGFLQDLSMSGARINAQAGSPIPRRGASLTLEFSLPGNDHLFIVECVASWIGNNTFGVSFKTVAYNDCALLWEHISTNAEGQVPNGTVRPCCGGKK